MPEDPTRRDVDGHDFTAAFAESTLTLLQRANAGDHASLEQLYARYLGPLRRFASHRLPPWARDLMETDDLVQETVLGSLRNVHEFEPEQTGAFHAYLRRSVLNRIKDEIRRVHRQPGFRTTYGGAVDSDPSPVERAIGSQTLERYEAVLASLKPIEQEAVIARLELRFSYRQIAAAINKPSPDAARMTVVRALVRLAEGMAER